MSDSLVIFDGNLPGNPFSAQRPRCDFERRRTYTPKKYAEELERLAWMLKAGGPSAPVAAPVDVVMRCYMADRRVHDVDNLAKTVLDAATGVLWEDDAQVVRLDISKVLGVGERAAHTRLLVRTAP